MREGSSHTARSYYFDAKEVRSVFFVLVFFKWCSDYIHKSHTGDTQWWIDDDVGYVDNVRGVSILCDEYIENGAILFDAAWFTESEMEKALLIQTHYLVENSESYTLPGWKSVAAAITFLKRSANLESVYKGQLGSFLSSLGIMLSE